MSATCRSYLLELLQGLHASGDTYKIALYNGTSLGATTSAYTTTGEVTGAGYTAGGETLTGYAVAQAAKESRLTWDSPAWSASTITATQALIYNSSAGNRAVCVLDFPETSSTNGAYQVTLPIDSVVAITANP